MPPQFFASNSTPTPMKMTPHRLLLLWAACFATLLAGVLPAVAADSKPPGKMAFQGFLTDANGVARGASSPVNLNIVFRLYNSPNSTAANAILWSESQVVTVDKGHFSIVLGEGTSISITPPGTATDLSAYFIGDNAPGRYLGITVGSETEITPRIQFFAAPYANLSRYATELVGTSGSTVLKVGANSVGINLAPNTTPSSELQVNGKVTATQFAGGGKDLTDLNGGNLSNSTVTSAKITDGTIVDADISGSAAIADSKLATISTAGKVADSALSANVARKDIVNTFVSGQVVNSANYFSGLRVNGSTTESAGLVLANTKSDGRQYDLFVASATAGNQGFNIYDHTASVHRFVINYDGNVGIGTYTPTQAKLVVSGGVTQNGLRGAYVNNSVVGHAVTHGAHTVSLYTSGTIWAGNAVIATSDARVKNVVGLTDGSADLRALLGIEVTDFRYRDTLENGDAVHKKVIAQQVEKVFPQAVSRHTNTVPDLYKAAAIHDGWVSLATDLKKGERVRLIDEKKESIHEVLEVADGRFRTDFTSANGKVFVYGREVKDFRAVDYESISMLNVSATQELARQVAALRASQALVLELEKKVARMAELEEKLSKMEAIERELSQLRKAVAQLAGLRQDSPAATLAAVASPANPASR